MSASRCRICSEDTAGTTYCSSECVEHGHWLDHGLQAGRVKVANALKMATDAQFGDPGQMAVALSAIIATLRATDT